MLYKINKFLQKFERVTSSGLFLPEIDGLRFIAIILVIIFHSQSVINLNNNYDTLNKSEYFKIFEIIVGNGWQGVELFFTISGFILGLPFAKYYFYRNSKVNLKTYFIRRLTRLEPPYIILMIIYFFITIIKDSGNILFWFHNLLTHLTYTHNIFMQPDKYLVSVAWSLEIEVQFYILAPIISIVFAIEKVKKKVNFSNKYNFIFISTVLFTVRNFNNLFVFTLFSNRFFIS